MWKASISTGLGFSEKAIWSRAARRQKENLPVDAMEDNEEDWAFGFKVLVEALPGATAGSRVMIAWLKGHDAVLFESFCGMMKRKLEEGN